MKPSVTIPEKSQINGSPCEPVIHGHSRPNAYQATIQHTNQHKQPLKQLRLHLGSKVLVSIRSYVLGPIKQPIPGLFHINTPFYSINDQTWHPNSPNNRGAVTACSIFLSKLLSIRSQVLGPIKRPLTASFNRNIEKHLKWE